MGDSDVESESGSEPDDYNEVAEEVDDQLLGEESESGVPTEDEDHDTPKTPSKNRKRKRDTTGSPMKATPRKRQKTLVHPTPHSKAAAMRKAKGKRKGASIHFPALQYGKQEDLSHLPNDAWLRAMHVLHVAARPDALPCREGEYDKILRNVGELLEEGSGGCVCEPRGFISEPNVMLTSLDRYIRCSRNWENGDCTYNHSRAEENG